MTDDIEINEEETNELVDDEVTENPSEETTDEAPEEAPEEKYTPEEKEEYGKRVQKRINQLNSKIHERDDIIEHERRAREDLQQRLDELENRFVESDAQRTATEIDAKLSDIQKQRLKLLDDGDYENAIALDDELLELKLKKREIATAPVSKAEPPRDTPKVPQTAQIPDAQREWLNDNDWYFNPNKAQEAQKANEVYLTMMREGYDADDPDTYQELTRRIKPRQKPTPPSAPDRGKVTGQKKPMLTNQDLEKMRDFGLDPNNPSHRDAWLAEKRA